MTAETDDLVTTTRTEDHIVTITLNRPDKANVVATPTMNHLLAEHLRAAQSDDTIKVIVLTGAGKHFCGGEDINRTPMDGQGTGSVVPSPAVDTDPANQRDRGHLDRRAVALRQDRRRRLPRCRDRLGFRLARYCDIVVASDDAYFGRPQSRIGLAGLDMGLPVLLARQASTGSYELLLTGRTATAEELRDWGFISSVVPRDRLGEEALRYARAIAAHSTDGLMIGRQATKMYWNRHGLAQWRSFAAVAHPLFTNLRWREDEVNLFKEW